MARNVAPGLPAASAMSRDHRKLRVFHMADGLVLRVYHVTDSFPADERYGLRSQMRRDAISTASNIVEGCARRTEREYGHFVNIAFGSAAEVRYLVGLAARLRYIPTRVARELDDAYDDLLSGLNRLLAAIDVMEWPIPGYGGNKFPCVLSHRPTACSPKP